MPIFHELYTLFLNQKSPLKSRLTNRIEATLKSIRKYLVAHLSDIKGVFGSSGILYLLGVSG